MNNKNRNILIIVGVVALIFLGPRIQYYMYMSELAGISSDISDSMGSRASSLASERKQEQPAKKVEQSYQPFQMTPLNEYQTGQSPAVVSGQPANGAQISTKEQIANLTKELEKAKYSYADLQSRMSSCTKRSDLHLRLECFDQLVHEDSIFANKNRAWQIERAISPIDDSVTYHLTISARETVLVAGNKNVRPTLSISCGSDPAFVALNGGQIFSYGHQSLTYRIGKLKPVRSYWRVDAAAESAQLTMSKVRFIHELVKSNKLAVQLNRELEQPLTLTFDTTELNQVENELVSTCRT